MITTDFKTRILTLIKTDLETNATVSIKKPDTTELINFAFTEARVTLVDGAADGTPYIIKITLSETDADISVGNQVQGFTITIGGDVMQSYTAADPFTFAAGEVLEIQDTLSI